MNPKNYNDNQRMVIDAYLWIRKHNMSIPDHILNVMKDAAIESFRSPAEPIKDLDDKYIVVKKEDLDNYIGEKGLDRGCFDAILHKIEHLREKNKKPHNRYVVLNLSDDIDTNNLYETLETEKKMHHRIKVKEIAVNLVNAILRTKKGSND